MDAVRVKFVMVAIFIFHDVKGGCPPSDWLVFAVGAAFG